MPSWKVALPLALAIALATPSLDHADPSSRVVGCIGVVNLSVAVGLGPNLCDSGHVCVPKWPILVEGLPIRHAKHGSKLPALANHCLGIGLTC